jgi:hydrogenase nickel incorporation protein HypA/HybF
MHEQSLMTDLMRKIESVVQENGAQRVASLKVRLGSLSHISPEHFKEHFVQASKGTSAESARLDVVVQGDLDDPNAQEIMLESLELEE